jgi:ribulose-phosphate 3-epimerase
MPGKFILSASILSADFTRLGEQIREAEQGGVDWIHVDVMDGHFVPNLTMGPFIVEACRRVTSLPLDVHLMVQSPELFLESFASAGASSLSVHVENAPNLHRTLQKIRELGCNVGAVLNPGTPASRVEPVLHLVDLVLVMSVNPGYSGQAFLPEVLPKIALIRKWLDASHAPTWIQIDGGMNTQTLPAAFSAGVRVFVAATSIFKHPQGIAAGVESLRSCLPDD